MIFVIGSGPAGVSCASALLDKGHEVTMIDGGVDLEPERMELVSRLSRAEPSDWHPEDLERLRRLELYDDGRVPQKRIYGSDHPYRWASRQVVLRDAEAVAVPTLSRGGFSNVWGAVVAPFREREIADWPERSRQLESHYEAVLRLIDLSAVEDGLAELFPHFSDSFRDLRPSRQAESFLEDCRAREAALRQSGILFGRSRLAVRAAASGDRPGCAYCGLCLHGCPYGLIYNSQSTVAALQLRTGFHYRPGVVVDRIVEVGPGVTVVGEDRADGSRVRLDGSRVFLACGVFPTTRILLATLGAYDQPLKIRDSQYALIPFLRYRATRRVETESLHTLAQAFLEMNDPGVSAHGIHIEVFTYNDLMLQVARARLGGTAPLLGWAVRALLRRLLIFQCFLHSDSSGGLTAHLESSEGQSGGRLVVKARPNPAIGSTVRALWRKLLTERSHLRGVPVTPMIEIAPPGRGFHSGGSFPMRSSPGRFEADVWGRPHSLQRVHAVDASVLPSLPATTITLPVMANAHRIGSGCGEAY